jgi:hypothetical protein
VTQKFNRGDHVKVADDLGPSMSHFQSGCEAIVIGSYRDQYGGGANNEKEYTLHIKGGGQSSWYREHQLTLIEASRGDLLQEWEDEAEALHKQRSDLDWIFANGPEVSQKGYGSSVEALGKCVGINDLWGSHGEGMSYCVNSLSVLAAAEPFLRTQDKAGWLEFSGKVRIPTADYRVTG